MFAACVQNGDEHAQFRGVSAAVIGGVVKERIAASQLGVKALHGLRHEIGAREDVNGYRLRRGEQFVPAAQDAAGAVVAARDDAGARRAHEGVLHGPGHGVEAPREHGKGDGIQLAQPSPLRFLMYSTLATLSRRA